MQLCKDVKKKAFEITHSGLGVFEEIFEKPIFDFLCSIEERIHSFNIEYPNIECNMDNILNSLGISLRNDLVEVFVRFFIGDLYKKKKMLVGIQPEDRYRDYIEHYLLPQYNVIFAEGSEMKRLLDSRVNLTISAVDEFFCHMGVDQELLKEILEITDFSVQNISIGLGDRHNGGKSIMIVSLGENQKLVYKPHPVYNDIIFAELLNWLNSRGLKVNIKHLRAIDRGTYGWQEYIPFNECNSEDEIKDYMYRLGCLLFVTYVMGSSDLHFENIIANGAYPIIIDTETLFSNTSSFNGKVQKSLDGWKKMFNESVFRSLLLPFDILDTKKDCMENISGIFGGPLKSENKKQKISTVINRGTDNISFSEIEWNVVKNKKNYNCASLCGQVVYPAFYIDSIVEGFTVSYNIIINSRQEFLDFLNNINFDRGYYRLIFRNTSLYENYLMASYHPYYIQNTNLRYFVLTHLKGKTGYISTDHEQLVQLEVEQLINGDVPYFYTKYTSKDVYSGYGKILYDFFEQTIEEQFIDRIKALNSVDLYRQSYFIRCAIAGQSDGNYSAVRYSTGIILDSLTDAREIAKKVIIWIYDFREKFHRIPERKGLFPMYYSTAPNEFKERLGIEAPILYEGAGSVLFYIQFARLFGDKYQQHAQQYADVYTKEHTYLKLANFKNEESIGLFTGTFSQIYLNYYSYHFFGDEKYLKNISLLYEHILQKFDFYDDVADIMSGFAGCIVISLNIWIKDTSMELFLHLAKKCGKRLLKMYKNNTLPRQSGFSHGYAGISSAFIMLGSLIQSEEYYAAGIELVKEEQKFYDKNRKKWIDAHLNSPTRNTWCYGAAGILVARFIALKYIKEGDENLLKRDISICLEQMKNDITGRADGEILCHGLAGNLDVMLWYAQQIQDKDLLFFVYRKTEVLLSRIINQGILCDNASMTLNVSFMAGITGIGYYLERFLDNSIPSVIALDI